MMAEVESVDGSETLSSGDSESARHSLDFTDPLGVNDQYHLCAAVDDESDEFDFDVSLRSIDVCLFAGLPVTKDQCSARDGDVG